VQWGGQERACGEKFVRPSLGNINQPQNLADRTPLSMSRNVPRRSGESALKERKLTKGGYYSGCSVLSGVVNFQYMLTKNMPQKRGILRENDPLI